MTKTQSRILALWSASPGSRTKRRMTELRKLVWRDLKRAARETTARKCLDGTMARITVRQADTPPTGRAGLRRAGR